MSEPVRYASAKDLGRVEDCVLTTGQTVRVERATLAVLVAEGRIPNPLRQLVLSIESGSRSKSLEEHPESLTEADVEEFEALRDAVLSDCIIEPKLTPEQVRTAFNPTDRQDLWEFAVHIDEVARQGARFRRLLGDRVEGAGDRGGAEGD